MPAGKDNDDLLQRLQAIFRVEAAEHLQALSTQLLALEKTASPAEQPGLIEALFREAHSLKGAARAVNRYVIESVCKALESAFGARKGIAPESLTPAWFETMYQALDGLERLLAAGDAEQAAQAEAGMVEIVRRLERLGTPRETPLPPLQGEGRGGDGARMAVKPMQLASKTPHPPPSRPIANVARATFPLEGGGVDAHNIRTAALSAAPATASPVAAGGDSVRISASRLAALQVQTEELLAFKFSTGHLAGELRALGADVAQWKKSWGHTAREARALRRGRERRADASREPRPAALDKLLDAIERDELAARAFGERLAALEHFAEQERRGLGGLVDGLQGDMRQAMLLPFAALLELMPKLVRDLTRDGGKVAELRVDGAAIEIDRRILEQMKDPLIHLVRNAIDHGIETADVRRAARKPTPARITIDIAPKEGNRVELVIADDGVGVDLEKVRAAAVRLGFVAAKDAAELSREATLALMFESGITTSPILTDLSGRGLGLAIVREKVELLGGSIAAELPATGGTLFRIVLPTVLATFRGLLVAVGGREERQFVLPARSVERVLRVAAASVKTVENRAAVEIDGQAVALVRLADVLGVPGGGTNGTTGTYLQLAVLESAGRRIAFAVDAILDDQDVLVKGLGPQLRRVPNIAGATVLGRGRVVPILDIADLLKSALRVQSPALALPAASAPAPKSLLVVEDSVTARALLKSILESAGYRVETAVDGIDALSVLRTGQFDLVVSDVEMPRMDGFDLTARIRADRKLADLPVVLVTALESREHKERGIEVGANAYIVKSSFDQSNLFAVIRRLI